MKGAIVIASVLLHGLLFAALEIAPRMRVPESVVPVESLGDPMPVAPFYLPERLHLPEIDPAQFTYCPAPVVGERTNLEGAVKLRVGIGRDGTMMNLDAISGHPLLLAAAMTAVKNWTYTPVLGGCIPDEVVATIEIRFKHGVWQSANFPCSKASFHVPMSE